MDTRPRIGALMSSACEGLAGSNASIVQASISRPSANMHPSEARLGREECMDGIGCDIVRTVRIPISSIILLTRILPEPRLFAPGCEQRHRARRDRLG